MESNVVTHINHINNKLQVLIKNYSLLKRENDELKSLLKDAGEREKVLNSNVDTMQQNLLILKASVAKMGDEEKKQFEKKLDQYIKDIDKCITALSQ